MKEPRKRKRKTKREFIREPTDDGNGSEKKKMERIKLTGDERDQGENRRRAQPSCPLTSSLTTPGIFFT
jgi:hypothetical protein